MSIKITKMQGCGNDFVILDYDEYKKGVSEERWTDMSDAAKRLCDRNFGVGADGFIVPNQNVEGADIGWFFYNSDGTTAQMCGNGIRCFAKYVYENGLVDKKEFEVSTLAGIIKPKLLEDGQVRVNMSKPILEAEKIPFIPSRTINYKIFLKDKLYCGNAISMGNPHYVCFVDDVMSVDVASEGSCLEYEAVKGERCNVEFATVRPDGTIRMRVWERGSGITLACGTGACATAVAACVLGLAGRTSQVQMDGGTLFISWSSDNHILMTGPAATVFEGTVTMED